MIRAFIAIDVPEDVKRTVSAVGGQLAARLPDGSVRWVKPNAMHLTLRFLGETAETQVPELAQALDEAVAGIPPFALRLGDLGAFPSPRQARVFWVGLSPVEPAPPNALSSLKTAVDAALAPLGWAAERGPFTPHLTLGRVRHGRLALPGGVAAPAATFPVTALQLIESDLRPDGPRHTVRHCVALGPN